MKTAHVRIPVFFLFFVTLFAACNKETYIETIGKVNIEAGDETEVGYFIFSSKTLVGSCGKVTLWIDGQVAGYLTGDYSGAVGSCTALPVEGKLVKIVAPVGNHKITVTLANDCKKFSTDSYDLKQGVCRYYALD